VRALISVLDLFRVGIGPSSSHTVGPMRIARRFLISAVERGFFEAIDRIHIELQGSLALTGPGHGAVTAVILGLLGHEPERVNPAAVAAAVTVVRDTGRIALLGEREIGFVERRDIDLAGNVIPDLHPNGMRLRATDRNGDLLADDLWYSTGGGFVALRQQLLNPVKDESDRPVPHPFSSGAELLEMCARENKRVDEIVLANEGAYRAREHTEAGLDQVISVMLDCIDRGLTTEGILPGGLEVRRRAPEIWRTLRDQALTNEAERIFDWLDVYAMAVNEENAAGGRVVTAPTNGAAGILPAVMKHYCTGDEVGFAMARKFLLTAGGIGLLYKQRASISGAEMGCQGEVGVACSMAAGGLAAVWGGTPQQVSNAAEIGMEHNLGLTCDPVGGLVQIPCIERNAIASVTAVNAARLSMHSDRLSRVTLDQVIETMRQTGLDMSVKYKETSQGGLAVNVVEC
jgi:L-serine dehydratase